MTARLPDMWPGLMRALPVSAHATHVTLHGIEFFCQYDYSQEVVVLEHAFTTEERGQRSATPCGPDLAEFLHSSQREAIEQAILLQIERSEQSARFAAQAAF